MTLEPFESDMEYYRKLCSMHGIQYTDDDAEDYAESVAIRIIEGGQSEKDARADQFKLKWGV